MGYSAVGETSLEAEPPGAGLQLLLWYCSFFGLGCCLIFFKYLKKTPLKTSKEQVSNRVAGDKWIAHSLLKKNDVIVAIDAHKLQCIRWDMFLISFF